MEFLLEKSKLYFAIKNEWLACFGRASENDFSTGRFFRQFQPLNGRPSIAVCRHGQWAWNIQQMLELTDSSYYFKEVLLTEIPS